MYHRYVILLCDEVIQKYKCTLNCALFYTAAIEQVMLAHTMALRGLLHHAGVM
jgi:hypothetical protein